LRERTKVRGAVKSFSFLTLSPPRERVKGEGTLFKSFHLPSSLSTPRERVRVRGLLLKSFHLPSSLSTLRERVRVRGIVKIFSSSFFPLHPAGEGQGEGDILSILLSPCGRE
jgi:hypothetical protein